MPELTIDIAVANRFISSLSKSLQALCHGCMEFDTGIEIIGYININIDSGSKVDYVLNEKVLKSTNNSMTFVSNSFLAKKDQQRHTRDGSCSPIPTIQQQITPIYQARHRGSNYGASFHRSSQFSPHSQVLHGGQKRQWGSELRSPVKKHRPAGATLEKSSSHSASYTPSTSHTFTDPNFRHSSAPTNADSIEGDSEVVNIKKEALDTDHELQDQVGEQDQSTDDPTAETSGNVIIKSDPDAVQSADSETNKDDTVATDFKGTFLDPSQEATGEQNDFSNSEKVLETISKPVLSDKHNVAGPSTEGTEDSNDTIPNSGADVSLDYDQGNEDYPQSDAGEATSDTGQFEVIEIDDEDEDVQAMFGESRHNTSMPRNKLSHQYTKQKQKLIYSQQSSETSPGASDVSRSYMADIVHPPDNYKPYLNSDTFQCSFCGDVFPTRILYQKHLNSIHREEGAFPYTCTICQKGFFSLTGLRHHMEAHKGRQFRCIVCDAKFQHKHHLKRHLEGVHSVKECRTCLGIFTLGLDFNSHVLQCDQGN